MPDPEVTSEINREEILKTQASAVVEIANNLELFLADSASSFFPLPKSGRTLDSVALQELLQRLQIPKEVIKQRLRKIQDRILTLDPKDLPFRFIAGQIVNLQGAKVSKGRVVRDDAKSFATFLSDFVKDTKESGVSGATSLKERREAARKATLLETLPERLSVLVAECETWSGEEESQVGQLMDPLCSTGQGIFITAEQKEEGPASLQGILGIMEALKYPEAAEILNQWVVQQLMAENYTDCIAALGVLAQAAFFLDEASLHSLYNSGGNGGIPYLPFRSLYTGAGEAIKLFKETKGGEESALLLQGVRRMIFARYAEIIRIVPELSSSYETGEIPIPNADGLASLFYDHFEGCHLVHDLSRTLAARYIVRYLELLKVKPDYVKEFCETITITDPQLSTEIQKEAIITGLLLDDGNKIARERLTEIKVRPWKDAVEIDPEEIAPAGTKKLEIFVLTATLGPAHKGHVDVIEKIEAFMKHKDLLDGGGDTRRILLILPITTPEDLESWHKSVPHAGSAEMRVASLLAQLPPDIDRTRVLISTKVQPSPSQVKSVENSVLVAVNRFTDWLNEKLEERGRSTTPDRLIIACAGADELEFRSKGGRLILTSTQPNKFKSFKDWFFIGRHPFLLALLDNTSRLTSVMSLNPNLVFTPGFPGKSSKKAIERINKGNLTDFRGLGRLLAVEHWSPKAIEKRERKYQRTRGKGGKTHRRRKVPSVTIIHRRMIEELERLFEEGN